MNIAFSQTTPQFRARTKDVTRRVGWARLRAGQVLTAIEKGQGLKKGETVVRLGRIRVVNVRRERLDVMTAARPYGLAEVRREGFPDLTPEEFVVWFARGHKIDAHDFITRIEFEYLDEEAHGDRPK